MAKFEISFNKMTAREGGYVNDPDDAGGETYKGVARAKQADWVGWLIIDAMKKLPNFPINLESRSDLQEQVKKFYRVMFWEKTGGDQITDQEVADSIFDFAVNTGVSNSVTLAQRVVGSYEDGKIGPNTIRAINSFNPDHFIDAYMVVKIRSYIKICLKRPDNKKYFFGWINRVVNP